MSYSPKTQARIWATSIIYKNLLMGLGLPYIKTTVSSLKDLCVFFNDDSVFVYDGDVDYFINLYNHVVLNFNDLLNQIRQHIDPRSLSELAKVCILCSIAEKQYMNIDAAIIFIEYSKLFHLYAENDSVLKNLYSNNSNT